MAIKDLGWLCHQHPSLGRHADMIHTYLQAATSQGTRRAYQSDIRHFLAWGGLLPTSPQMLLGYLQDHASHLNPRTLERRLVAMKHWHTYQGFPDPTQHPLVKKILSGIRYKHGKPPEKAPPLSVEQLILLVDYLKSMDVLSHHRNSALLQIGFFGALRRSELVAIDWEHVRFVPQGVEILIPRSKTDQTGEGHVCAIPYGKATLCPVTTLGVWKEKSAKDSGPVFRQVLKGHHLTERAMSGHSVNQMIKALAMTCQLPQAEQYSAHSLRRGLATSASQHGASLVAIMRQGRWRHEGTVHGYIEEGQRFEANAAGFILEALG